MTIAACLAAFAGIFACGYMFRADNECRRSTHEPRALRLRSVPDADDETYDGEVFEP